MKFEVSAHISRPPAFVFAALTSLNKMRRDPRSVVPVYEKTTPGPVGGRDTGKWPSSWLHDYP